MITIHAELLTNALARPYLRHAEQSALRSLKGVVVHMSEGKEGAAARRQWYESSSVPASVHYIVDDRCIIQCIPDNELALHTSGKQAAISFGTQEWNADYFYLGVELCSPPGSDWAQVRHHGAALCAYLLRKHRLSERQLLADSFSDTLQADDGWNLFVASVTESMAEMPEGLAERARVDVDHAAVIRGPGTHFPAAEHLPSGSLVAVFEYQGPWRRIGRQLWMSAGELRKERPELLYQVRESIGAQVRSGPGMHFPVVDALPHRSIVDALRQEEQWVAVGEQRWLHHAALSPVRISHGEVWGTAMLNVRSGPDTTYHVVHRLPQGTVLDIWEEHGAWFRIGEGEWVYGSFVNRL